MEDFNKYSEFDILYSKSFNFDIDTMSNYFENPQNICNTPMTDQFFYFYTKDNEKFLKTGGYVLGTNINYSVIYKLGDLKKSSFKHYRKYKLIKWNDNDIKFDIFFTNYFYQNTCENKTCVFKILSTNYSNNEEKEIYIQFLNSLKYADFNESYSKGIEFMIKDKSLFNELSYSILLKNCNAKNVFEYIKTSDLYKECLDSENLNQKVNGIIGNPGVNINLYDKEGKLSISYLFNEPIEKNGIFILEFSKEYIKNVKISQHFHIYIIKISNNDCFLYIKKEVLNLVSYDKLNLLKYIFLSYFKKIIKKFSE
jgi:hypothetical protein